MHLRSSLFLGVLFFSVLFVTGCDADALDETTTASENPVDIALEIPTLFRPEEDFIELTDFTQGWKRFTTKEGKFSFLYPASWEVDASEWNISRTVFVGTAEDASHPVDILLTVHGIGERTMEEAVENQYEQIRINPLTERIIRTETSFLDPERKNRTLVAFRTTLDPNQSFLHLIIPRRSSLLTVETLGTDPFIAYPVRVLLESISFRD